MPWALHSGKEHVRPDIPFGYFQNGKKLNPLIIFFFFFSPSHVFTAPHITKAKVVSHVVLLQPEAQYINT